MLAGDSFQRFQQSMMVDWRSTVLAVCRKMQRCFGAAEVLVVHSSVEPESGWVVPLGSVVFSLGRPVLSLVVDGADMVRVPHAYRVLALPRAAVESNRGCDS